MSDATPLRETETRIRVSDPSAPDGCRFETVGAYRLDSVEGLAIHRSTGEWGWTVTHCRSGCAVRKTPSRQAALAALERLGSIADWTSDADALRASLEHRVDEVVGTGGAR